MLDPIYISALVGLGAGVVSSLTLGVASQPGPNQHTRMLFGVTTSEILTDAFIAVMIAAVIFLSVMSALVRDLEYPRAHPLMFSVETLMMAIVPAILFAAMAPMRGHQIQKVWKEVVFLGIKFGLVHILFQFSGLYSATLFPPQGPS